MGSGEYSCGDVFDGRFECGPLRFVRIVAEEGDGGSRFVENSDASLKFGYSAEIAEDTDRAGATQIGGVDADLVAFEIVVLEATVFTVGYEEARRIEAGIDRDAVTGFGLVFFRAFAAEGFEELTLCAENVHEIRTVANDRVDASVGSDCDCGETFEGAGKKPV